MTYFNPKIYNVKNLKEQEAKEIETADFLVSQVITQLENDYIFEKEHESTPILSKIKAEIALEILDEIALTYHASRRECIGALIDNYEEGYECQEYPEFAADDTAEWDKFPSSETKEE